MALLWCPLLSHAESTSYTLKVIQEATVSQAQNYPPGFPEAFTLTNESKIVGMKRSTVQNEILTLVTPHKTIKVSVVGTGMQTDGMVDVTHAGNERGDVFLLHKGQIVSLDQSGQLITVVGIGHLVDGKKVLSVHDPIGANNKGQLVFLASLEGGGGLCTLEKCVAKSGDTLDSLRIERFGSVFLTDNGDVVFSATVSGGGVAIFKNDRALVKTGDVIGGKTIGVISDQFVSSSDGHIVFEASSNDMPGGLFTLDGLVVKQRDLINGLSLTMWQNLTVNNKGEVAFLGCCDNGTPETVSYAIVLATPAGGTASPTGQEATVTAKTGGRSKLIPVLILGSIAGAIFFFWPRKPARRTK
jgi:hypothetical protein